MELKYSVHHVVPRIHSEASGTTYVVPRLCNTLHELGVDTHLHVIRAAEQVYRFPLHIYKYWPALERLGYAPAMKKALIKSLAEGKSILHNHSLWMMPNIYAGQVGAKYKTKLIVSPHGTISTWALGNSRLKKKLMWHLGQKKVFQFADCFHATAESEYEDIRRLGFRQPVAIIPNGVDFPRVMKVNLNKKGLQKLLFLGRLHPQKGLDNLLVIWGELHLLFPDWELLITGPEDKPGYKARLRQKVAEYGLKRIRFHESVFGEDKSKLYAEAELFVLPSYSENFGITVAEALYQHTPAVVTEGAPWEVLNSANCGWWVRNSVEELRHSLAKAMSLSKAERSIMGKNGHNLVTQAFSWEKVGMKMQKTYEWMLTNQEKPNWIINE